MTKLLNANSPVAGNLLSRIPRCEVTKILTTKIVKAVSAQNAERNSHKGRRYGRTFKHIFATLTTAPSNVTSPDAIEASTKSAQ